MDSTRNKAPKKYNRGWGLLGRSHAVLMMLIEVCVYSSVNATQNLALGKPAYLKDTGYGGVPSRAVDGNTNGNYNGYSCACSSTISNVWWKVDLGDVYVIEHVTVFNRLDCCGERLQHVQLFIGLHDINYTLHGYHAGIVGSSYTFNMTPYVYGRWVMITRVPGREVHVLTLCEVQVMGYEIVYDFQFKQGEGMIGTGVPLDTSQARTRAVCCIQCKMTAQCVAVNYNIDTGVCVKLGTLASISDSNESNYFYRSN